MSSPAANLDVFSQHGVRVSLDDVISMVEGTRDADWQVGTVRSEDGQQNCFFGHLHAMGAVLGEGLTDDIVPARLRARVSAQDHLATLLWHWFEEAWATTYAIYPVNDGTDARFPQATPRDRILAYLHGLKNGTVKTTYQQIEEYLASLPDDDSGDGPSEPQTRRDPAGAAAPTR